MVLYMSYKRFLELSSPFFILVLVEFISLFAISGQGVNPELIVPSIAFSFAGLCSLSVIFTLFSFVVYWRGLSLPWVKYSSVKFYFFSSLVFGLLSYFFFVWSFKLIWPLLRTKTKNRPRWGGFLWFVSVFSLSLTREPFVALWDQRG